MSAAKDLTSGNIRAQFLSLALPLLAGNILQQLYNTVDAVIVGRFVGDAAFAAVGVAGSVMNLFLFLLSGACTGISVLLAQFHGEGNGALFRRGFFLSAVFGGAMSLMLTLLGRCILPHLLRALSTPEEVMGHAQSYLQIVFLGLLVSFAYHLCSVVLRAVGNTQTALVFLTISMAANLILDLLFIGGFNMSVAGAAWATVAAQALSAVLCGSYLVKCFPSLVFHREDMGYDGALLRRTVRFSLGAALQMCGLYIGKLLVQGAVNSLGTAAIAAYTGATRIEGFANSFGDSGTAAMSVFIGQNTGAGNTQRVRRGFVQGECMLVGLGLAMSLGMLVSAPVLLPLVLPEGDGASLAPGVGYLRLVACFYLFNFLGCGLSGYYQGRGRIHLPVIGSTGHIALRALLSWQLAPVLSLPAVALATGLGWIGVVLFWSVVLRRTELPVWRGETAAYGGQGEHVRRP